MVKISPAWFVARTHRLDDRGISHLQSAGFGVFVPTRRREVYNRRMRKWRTYSEPLMPGYAFVQSTPAASWPALRRCEGVVALLGQTGPDGLEPIAISSTVVESLMASIAAGEYDDTRATRALRNGPQALSDLLPAGSPILIANGPLIGHSGRVVRVTKRGQVEVLVRMLGMERNMRIEPAQIDGLQMLQAA